MSIAEALRAEILRVLTDAKEFTPATCAQIERIARSGKDVLRAAAGISVQRGIQLIHGMDDDGMGMGDSSVSSDGGLSVIANPSSALTTAPAVETFGVKVIQEIIAALPAILGNNHPKRQQDDPLKLVLAIKAAREAGMEELAIDLEERLTGFVHPARVAAPEAVPAEGDPDTLAKLQAQETRPMSPGTIRKLQEVHFPKLDGEPLVPDVPVHIGGGGTIHMEDPLGRRRPPSELADIPPYEFDPNMRTPKEQ